MLNSTDACAYIPGFNWLAKLIFPASAALPGLDTNITKRNSLPSAFSPTVLPLHVYAPKRSILAVLINDQLYDSVLSAGIFAFADTVKLTVPADKSALVNFTSILDNDKLCVSGSPFVIVYGNA